MSTIFNSVLYFYNNPIVKNVMESNFPTNSTVFNLSTSTGAVVVSGINTCRTCIKAIYTPFPWCKTLYLTSSALSAVSTVSNLVSLCCGFSCFASPIGWGALSLGYVTNWGAKACKGAGDCMDPGQRFSEAILDKSTQECIEKVVETIFAFD